MTRVRRTVAIVVALVALQIGAIAVYLHVDRGRRAVRPFDVTPLPGSRAPALIVETADGARLDPTPAGSGPYLVHFWATWCPPCRDELPELLARAAATPGVWLVAVSVDDDWHVVREFFGGRVPPAVARAVERDAHRRYGALTLPDTYVVSRDGRLVERIAGARDWRRSAAQAYLRALPGRFDD